MNYEEKYNAALSRATFYNNELLTENQRKMLEVIFPELAESEDEITRKSLIRFLKSPFVHENITDEKVFPWIAWLEKQGEQPTKIEPKFKVGNWVILNGIVAKILDKQKYGFVGLDIDGKDFFCNYGHTDSMRLWTINDAKDGDVLVTEDYIFIFKYILHGGVHRYCHYKFDDEEFDSDIPDAVIGNIRDKGIHFRPATKEQRDLLFQKMKEAGYEWNTEKMEATSKESEDEITRKSLIRFLKSPFVHENIIDEKVDPWIAWLEKQGKTLNPDKVIAWLVANICDYEYYVKLFKKDFGI